MGALFSVVLAMEMGMQWSSLRWLPPQVPLPWRPARVSATLGILVMPVRHRIVLGHCTTGIHHHRFRQPIRPPTRVLLSMTAPVEPVAIDPGWPRGDGSRPIQLRR